MRIDFDKIPEAQREQVRAMESVSAKGALAFVRAAYPDALLKGAPISMASNAKRVLANAVLATDAWESTSTALEAVSKDYAQAALSNDEPTEGNKSGIKYQTRLLERDIHGGQFTLVLAYERKRRSQKEGNEPYNTATAHTMADAGVKLVFPSDPDTKLPSESNGHEVEEQVPEQQ